MCPCAGELVESASGWPWTWQGAWGRQAVCGFRLSMLGGVQMSKGAARELLTREQEGRVDDDVELR